MIGNFCQLYEFHGRICNYHVFNRCQADMCIGDGLFNEKYEFGYLKPLAKVLAGQACERCVVLEVTLRQILYCTEYRVCRKVIEQRASFITDLL